MECPRLRTIYADLGVVAAKFGSDCWMTHGCYVFRNDKFKLIHLVHATPWECWTLR
jgi:hypothetical protein